MMPAVHETAYPRLKEAVTPAGLAQDLAEMIVGVGQVAPVVGDRGLGPGQLSRELEGGAEFPFRLRWPDHQQEEYAEVVVGVRHLAAEFGLGRVLPGQVASDSPGPRD